VAAAALGHRVARFISHRVDNDVIGISGLLSRAATDSSGAVRSMLDHAGELVRSLGDGFFLSAYEQALVPAEPVEVLELARKAIGEAEWHLLAAGLRIRCIGSVLAWVRVNPFILREAVAGLIHNAGRALKKRHRAEPPGAIAVDVRLHERGPLPDKVTVSTPAVVIEVADNGPGFTPAELLHYDALTTADRASRRPLSARSGPGTGLSQIVAWLDDYNSCLRPMRSERFGGASVSIWLPAIPAPTDGGTP
jgi:signal transduction histidine kinase